jgi:hypothetical protein
MPRRRESALLDQYTDDIGWHHQDVDMHAAHVLRIQSKRWRLTRDLSVIMARNNPQVDAAQTDSIFQEILECTRDLAIAQEDQRMAIAYMEDFMYHD